METITFNGRTQEEAENKKAEWLSAHNRLIVIAVRNFPLTRIPNHPYAPVEYAVSIELDYEGLDSNSARHQLREIGPEIIDDRFNKR
jgi:hypothetical protein